MHCQFALSIEEGVLYRILRYTSSDSSTTRTETNYVMNDKAHFRRFTCDCETRRLQSLTAWLQTATLYIQLVSKAISLFEITDCVDLILAHPETQLAMPLEVDRITDAYGKPRNKNGFAQRASRFAPCNVIQV